MDFLGPIPNACQFVPLFFVCYEFYSLDGLGTIVRLAIDF